VAPSHAPRVRQRARAYARVARGQLGADTRASSLELVHLSQPLPSSASRGPRVVIGLGAARELVAQAVHALLRRERIVPAGSASAIATAISS